LNACVSDVVIFPRDTGHRLVGDHLAAFLDRVGERIVALGAGAGARVEAGSFVADVWTHLDLVEAIDAARAAGAGREDLRVTYSGDARDGFARFVGARRVDAVFHAYVLPATVERARPCAACGAPMEGRPARARCAGGCGAGAGKGRFAPCWRLDLEGRPGPGLGPRFVDEGRRLTGTPFLEALAGTARTPLFEWHPS
jgi:hypothetical protein